MAEGPPELSREASGASSAISQRSMPFRRNFMR
jgi:hypothetical protein